VDIHAKVSQAAEGLTCTAVALYAPGSWSFDFEGQFGLNVQCPWRIVNEYGVALGGEDDAQMFGRTTPVDGATAAMELLRAKPVIRLVITDKTGDLLLEFESGLRLEAFNNSSGYEGWSCGTPSGLEVIGMGGGGTANSNREVSSKPS
jgi:Family of unknown function (DUF6188)